MTTSHLSATATASSKRKATLLDFTADVDWSAERDAVKRLKRAGIEIAKTRRNPLPDLFFHPSLTLEDFGDASSSLGPSALRWRDVLDQMDCSRPESPLFLERLQDFLHRHGGCRAHRAITILSTWATLSCPSEWKEHVDLIELLLTFVEEPKRLLKAVAHVRDDKEWRNQNFFSLLIRHIRLADPELAEAEESLVTEAWPDAGHMAKAERREAEREQCLAEADLLEACYGNELASEFSSESEDGVEDDVPFQCDVRQDLLEWMQDRTEASSSQEHRCPAEEARKDYEEWVSQSAFTRQRVGKQEFAKCLERWHPKVAQNGHRFFTGLVLK
jgi:hypothetical protein